MNSLTKYLETYALISLEKQEKFSRLIGEHSAEIDIDSGRIRFSASYEVPFQVLGTESDNTLTWLWAWADEQMELPHELMASSLQLKAWGERNGVREYTVPSMDIDKADGRLLSIIASAVCEAGCFYRDDYEGGALFLLLFDKSIERQPGFDSAGLSRQFSDLMTSYQMNHRNAFVSYCRAKGLHCTEHGTIVDLELESSERIRLEFDSSETLKTINGLNMPLD
jgi:hypothetical protein